MTKLEKKIRDLTEHAMSLEIEADRAFIMSQYERGDLLMSRRTEILADVEQMKVAANASN
jgi:hypothetical protein